MQQNSYFWLLPGAKSKLPRMLMVLIDVRYFTRWPQFTTEVMKEFRTCVPVSNCVHSTTTKEIQYVFIKFLFLFFSIKLYTWVRLSEKKFKLMRKSHTWLLEPTSRLNDPQCLSARCLWLHIVLIAGSCTLLIHWSTLGCNEIVFPDVSVISVGSPQSHILWIWFLWM